MIRRPDVVALCCDLIAVNSENPPGREAEVVACAADLLGRAGFDLETVEPQPGRRSLVARLHSGRGRRLILQAHADTKPAGPVGVPGGWSSDPFVPVERDGLLVGLGACDTKGGLAAQLAAACELAHQPGWSGELVVQVVADEEDGSALGAETLLEMGLLRGDGAVVAEPTGCLPSLAQLGNAWSEITIDGRAAHAGHPERGRDAFRAMTRLVTVLDELLSTVPTHPAFPGHPRLNVGDLALPGHPGTVPGRCRMRCDVRISPGADRDDTHALYRRAAEQVATELGVDIAVAPYQGGGCRSHEIPLDHPLAQAFLQLGHASGHSGRTLPFAGGTDARYFAAAGTPALVHGPGHLEQAHAPDEFVPVAQLRLAQRQLVALAHQFLVPTRRPSPIGARP